MEKLRQNTRKITYIIFGSIAICIFLYLVFLIIGVSKSSLLMQALTSISTFFSSPFVGTISRSYLDIFQGSINPDYIAAIFGYLFGAIAVGEFLTAFMYDKLRDVIQNFVDALFKFFELFLLIRIILDLFGSSVDSVSPVFLQFIYALTNWSGGLFPSLIFLGLTINISAIIYLAIISLIDSQFEKILDVIFDFFNFGNTKVNLVKPVTKVTQKIIYVTNPKRIIKIRRPRKEVVVVKEPVYYDPSVSKKVNQKFISDNQNR